MLLQSHESLTVAQVPCNKKWNWIDVWLKVTLNIFTLMFLFSGSNLSKGREMLVRPSVDRSHAQMYHLVEMSV